MSRPASALLRSRFAALLCGAAACFTIVGCGDAENDGSTPEGETVTEVPSVQGLDAADAVDALCAAGFNVEVTQSVDASLDTGSLAGESAPRGGAAAEAGTTVVLQVFSRSTSEVSIPAPDGCRTQVVEVVPEPGGGTYG